MKRLTGTHILLALLCIAVALGAIFAPEAAARAQDAQRMLNVYTADDSPAEGLHRSTLWDHVCLLRMYEQELCLVYTYETEEYTQYETFTRISEAGYLGDFLDAMSGAGVPLAWMDRPSLLGQEMRHYRLIAQNDTALSGYFYDITALDGGGNSLTAICDDAWKVYSCTLGLSQPQGDIDFDATAAAFARYHGLDAQDILPLDRDEVMQSFSVNERYEIRIYFDRFAGECNIQIRKFEHSVN